MPNMHKTKNNTSKKANLWGDECTAFLAVAFFCIKFKQTNKFLKCVVVRKARHNHMCAYKEAVYF